ncbi:MAG: glycine betaine ABC transporter substrate-binding protein [Solirubrobacteraceae bacterium]
MSGGIARRVALLLAVLAMPVLTGCAAQYSGGGDGPLKGAKIAFGSKDFTEQKVLGQIAVQYLRSQGAAVWDQTGLVSSEAVRGSLTRGDIDAYWEYTGTAWITYLGHERPIADPDEQFAAVAREDREKHGIRWINRAPLNNTYALAVKEEKAEELGITSLAEIEDVLASDRGSDLTFCVDSEFANREDGFPGVQRAYGFKAPSDRTKRLDLGLIYSQIGNGTCTFGEVFETDGRIKGLGLRVLDDPDRFFPPYSGAISIREELLREHPQIEEVMAPIAERLTTEQMQVLNAKVDIDGQLPDKVAEDWLEAEGLVD